MLVTLLSCGGGGDDPEPDPVPISPPSSATLVFPSNNEECNTGDSLNATQSKVNFQWNSSANTNLYTVIVKNLLTGTEFSTNATSNQMDIIISKSTPYKWWVISKSNETTKTAKSAEWKFYNSGDGVKTYAPFPAELIAPVMGISTSDGTVTIEWIGSDVDNDIKEYDVYFGIAMLPTTILETTTNQKIENVAVSANTYYWKVVTRDDEGNTSTSEVFQFKVVD
ncbi:MAG: hypothetical protein COB01_02515 [Lutibacter sp.]|nr:MAG: hypothetical protein COB01_02515 [Lutibacter sp.]